jgi:hypothetical protein
MTVSTTTAEANYQGDGASTVLAVPFYFLANAHLLVQQINTTVTPQTITTLALGSGYTVNGAGVESGGSITLATPAAIGIDTYITRNVPATQLIHYVPNDEFPAATHEQALDQLTMLCQQIENNQNLAVTIPPNGLGLISPILPYPTAGYYLGWDPTGKFLLNLPATATDNPGIVFDSSVASNAAIQSTKLNYLAPYTGASALSVNAKLAQFVHINDFGGDPTGTNDSTAALNAAVTAIGSNGRVIFGNGTYKFLSSITVTLPSGPAAVTFEGQGPSSTILTWPSATSALTFNCSSNAHSIHMRGFALTTGAAGTATGITVNQSSPLGRFETSTFFWLTFRGQSNTASTYWATCANISNYSGTSWDSCTFMGGGATGGNGLFFSGTGVGGTGGSNYSIYHNIAKCILNSLANGVVYGAYAQGITVDQCNCQNTNVGIYSPSSASNTGQSQLNVLNSQFNCFSTAILLQATGNGNITIVGNDIIVPATSNDNAISITGCVYGQIDGNSLNSLSTTLTFGVVLSGCSYFNVSGNIFDTFDIAVDLTGATVGCTVGGNTYNGCTTNVNDASSSATNSVYFDNATAAANLTVGSSPFTHTAGSSPEIHYVFGGTVSNISKGAVQTAATSNVMVHLKPHESYTVTYSSLPDISFEKQ